MQATWQALQPMHLVVSMSLATVSVPVPAADLGFRQRGGRAADDVE